MFLGEIETMRVLNNENPKLSRPFVLNAASGRYSRDMKVRRSRKHTRKLPLLTSRNFDRYIIEICKPTQLVIVCLVRPDTQAHVWAETLMEYVAGKVAAQGKGASGAPYRLAKFDMTESDFVERRYGVVCVFRERWREKLVACD